MINSKILYLFSLFICYAIKVFSQDLNCSSIKSIIDTTSLDQWLFIEGKSIISNDGNYVIYNTRSNNSRSLRLSIQRIRKNWTMSLDNVSQAAFTSNCRKVVCIKSNDSLCIVELDGSAIEYVSNVSSFQFFKQGKTEWLIYQLNTPNKELILKDFTTKRERSFSKVNAYSISKYGNTLVLKSDSVQSNCTVNKSLIWVDLLSGKSKIIWQGAGATDLTLDDKGLQVAFIADAVKQDSLVERVQYGAITSSEKKVLWYYKEGYTTAIQLTNNKFSEVSDLEFHNLSGFSKEGSRLFLLLKEKRTVKRDGRKGAVDIWSYNDAKLQSEQIMELGERVYKAVFYIDKYRLIQIEKENELELLNWANLSINDNTYVQNIRGNANEAYWNCTARAHSYLVSTLNGTRRPVSVNFRNPELSPNQRFIVGMDDTLRDFFSYEIATGTIRNLTKTVQIPFIDMKYRDSYDRPIFKYYRGVSFGAWLENGEEFLIYDDFDIWLIDPAGRKPSINITNGYGRRNSIVFRLIEGNSENVISGKGELVLKAHDKISKKSGFFKITMGRYGNPVVLSMGPYVYLSETKAKNSKVFLIKRESTSESPNLFWTMDFKKFIPISHIYPERDCNWMTAELLSFTTLDGLKEQAILYRPEDFDPGKKYPVIINYYERKSQDLFKYHQLGSRNGGNLDISWFTSRGYLVLTPDIHYKVGEPGQSVYNSIVGAATFLIKYPWVDKAHIGIQGHSFGGYETNYLLTHSNFFAAAMSSSGISDLISRYGTDTRDGRSQNIIEVGQYRLGAALWHRPDLFIKNSPVFAADKVSTPLLMLANKDDGNVPYAQGIELFMALRRLGKRVWMLQYDGEGHGVTGYENYKDFIIRMTQFFDHYLKGEAAPKWMTRGVPAKQKGIDSGLELDSAIKTPEPSILVDPIK